MAYTGTSIVDYLNSVGKDSSYTNRAKLAAANGISNYTGTAAQNTQLLSILNKPATTTTPKTTTTSPTSTPNTTTTTNTTNNNSSTTTNTSSSSGIPSTVTNTGIKQPTSFTASNGTVIPAGSILALSKYSSTPMMIWFSPSGTQLYYEPLTTGTNVQKYAPNYYTGASKTTTDTSNSNPLIFSKDGIDIYKNTPTFKTTNPWTGKEIIAFTLPDGGQYELSLDSSEAKQYYPQYYSATGKSTTTSPTNSTPSTNTQTTNTSTYTGASVVDFLNSKGQDSSFTSRAKLAAANGISNYTGTAEQNTQLLNLLKNSTTQSSNIQTPVSSSYTGTSIVDFLNLSGQDSSFTSRAKLAAANGISNYTGTAEQNTQLLNTLKSSTPVNSNTQTQTSIQTSNPNAIVITEENQYNQMTGEKLPIGTVYDSKTGAIISTSSNQNTQQTTGTTNTGTTNTGTSSPSTTDSKSPYYGQTSRTSAWEQAALQEEKAVETAAKGANIISSSFMAKISSDPELIGLYVNALAYGGYTIGDVLNDMKRRELIANGNTQAKNMASIINPTMKRTDYLATSEGQKSVTDTASIIPTFNLQGLMDPEILKYGSNIPDELFKPLVPLLDETSQAFKDAVADYKSAYYDLANQQLQAKNEQEKNVADYNYEKFKEEINRKYGILLSDDATKAWSQLESIGAEASKGNILGSGLQNETIDQALKDIRKTDQRSREEKMTAEESEMAKVYQSSATPAQIQALINEDKAKGLPKSEWRATKWGLVPSDEVLDEYKMSNLKERYPDQSEEELQAYRDSVLDENGNYRSSIYSNYYTKTSENKVAKTNLAKETIIKDAASDEARAYASYDKSQPFYTGGTDTETGKTSSTSSTTEMTSEEKKAAQQASEQISSNINKTTVPTTGTTQTPTSSTQSSASTYSGTSIVDYLNSQGKASDFSSRAKLAADSGITNYTGTAEQNLSLLATLKGVGK